MAGTPGRSGTAGTACRILRLRIKEGAVWCICAVGNALPGVECGAMSIHAAAINAAIAHTRSSNCALLLRTHPAMVLGGNLMNVRNDSPAVFVFLRNNMAMNSNELERVRHTQGRIRHSGAFY